eukprot:1850724-Rhodomonas_salina.1
MARACWDAVTETFTKACTTEQSSGALTGVGAAAAAVDTVGKNGAWGSAGCTHTDTADNQWWYVNLGTAMPVHRLLIWNRDSFQTRLN